MNREVISKFLEIKRQEYEEAKRENKKFLQDAISQSVIKTIKHYKLKPEPKQLNLFD